MANWFVQSGGITNGRGRMAALIARNRPARLHPCARRPPGGPSPCLHPDGALVALAFGQMRAETLQALAALGHELALPPGGCCSSSARRNSPRFPA